MGEKGGRHDPRRAPGSAYEELEVQAVVQVVWILIQDKGDAREGCQMRLIDADALIKRFKELKIRSKDLTIDYKRGHRW